MALAFYFDGMGMFAQSLGRVLGKTGECGARNDDLGIQRFGQRLKPGSQINCIADQEIGLAVCAPDVGGYYWAGVYTDTVVEKGPSLVAEPLV